MALSFEYKLLKWGYTEKNGPCAWDQWYPVSKNGKRQSPIDIKTEVAHNDPQLPPVKAKYDQGTELNLENTGVSWQLHFHDPEISSLTGGPLDQEYKIVQMHAHWGDVEGVGSEHTLNGAPFDAELHIVHYNTKYGSPGEAFDKEDGLAVLGVFLKVGKEHQELQKVLGKLKDLDQIYDVAAIEESILVENLLPANKSYFTYPGSLTTPPLYESVTWIVFNQHIEISQEQLNAMRSMKTGCGRKRSNLVNNFRPTCDQAERPIRFCCHC